MEPSRAATELLSRALRRPECLASLTLPDWDLLIRQARRADLLARLCILLDEADGLASVPAGPRGHLEAARTLASKHARDVRWEVRCIRHALAELDIPILLLKGAAYVVAGLPPARGRLFADIDIMVPKDSVAAVEEALRRDGWIDTKLGTYDQRYYRTWMHQIPPMLHYGRQSVIDVHHAIVPLTARSGVRSEPLFSGARALEGRDRLFVLAPADMVLHSAVHLFNEGEFEHGLRDLAYLDDQLRHFSTDPEFWPTLVARARALNLRLPLYLALRHGARLLGTPAPEPASAEIETWRPRGAVAPVMDALLSRALRPDHRSCDDRFTGLARWLLYLRAHWLRMPLHLLLPHLLRKAISRRLKD